MILLKKEMAPPKHSHMMTFYSWEKGEENSELTKKVIQNR